MSRHTGLHPVSFKIHHISCLASICVSLSDCPTKILAVFLTDFIHAYLILFRLVTLNYLVKSANFKFLFVHVSPFSYYYPTTRFKYLPQQFVL
jgi:hypothetical protein